MKRFFRLLIGIIFVFGFQLYAYGADGCKIAVVDMQKFMGKSRSFQKISEDYMKKVESKKKALEQEEDALRNIKEELKKQSMMLSLDAKEDKLKELAKKSRHLKYLENEFIQEMKEVEVETMRRVGKEIAGVVEKIGKDKGYLMILEKRPAGFLYNDEKIDITDDVIKAYDEMKQ